MTPFMKEITKILLIFQIVSMVSCATVNHVVNTENESLKEFVGKKITLIGKTVNAKLGAALVLENGQHIWLDEMGSWPNGYYTENESKSAEVTGVLIERYDLPVFISSTNDSLKQQGIPVPKGTNLKEASHRYLLKSYNWHEIN